MQNYPWERLSVLVHSSGVYKDGPDWSIPYRKNHFTALWYMAQGNIRLDLGGQVVTADSGDFLLIPIGVPFSAYYRNGCDRHETVAIRFAFYTAEQLDWFSLYRLPFRIQARAPEEWVRSLLRIVELTDREVSTVGRLEANGLLQSLLGQLIADHMAQIVPIESVGYSKQMQVIRLLRWMEEHLAERFTLSQLAKSIHVSTDYVIELFRSVMGVPPMHYLNQLRVNRAKQLLLHRDLTVKEISRQVGFADPLYFSKLFRKTVGVPPSQFQSSQRQL